jgi:hypothetical protein
VKQCHTLHVTPDSETTPLGEFERGLLTGLLIGEGHFGGDGRQPHVTLRMHARHEPLLRRLTEWVPGSKLYGPYHHGGRHYCQWMARGAALHSLLRELASARIPIEQLDSHVASRFARMLDTYRAKLPSQTP